MLGSLNSKALTPLWEQQVPQKSEVSRLTAFSIQNPSSDTVPRRCLLPKRTVNRPSKKTQKTKKHSSCCICPPLLREGNCTLCDRCHKKWICLEICHAAFCFLPPVGPWQRYLMNPGTFSFITPRAEEQELGRDCAFGKPGFPQS